MDKRTEKELINQELEGMKKIMSVKRFSETNLASIWFVNDTHKENFNRLIEKFHAQNNPEYAAPIYVVSHPEIFHRINWNKSDGPVGWYWGAWIGKDDNDDDGYHEESATVGGLSSAYRSLVRAAVELYTGSKHYFDLMALIGNAGDEVYRLFIQMLEIRRDRHIIDLHSEV
jgi:hypothetical protein